MHATNLNSYIAIINIYICPLSFLPFYLPICSSPTSPFFPSSPTTLPLTLLYSPLPPLFFSLLPSPNLCPSCVLVWGLVLVSSSCSKKCDVAALCCWVRRSEKNTKESFYMNCAVLLYFSNRLRQRPLVCTILVMSGHTEGSSLAKNLSTCEQSILATMTCNLWVCKTFALQKKQLLQCYSIVMRYVQ